MFYIYFIVFVFTYICLIYFASEECAFAAILFYIVFYCPKMVLFCKTHMKCPFYFMVYFFLLANQAYFVVIVTTLLRWKEKEVLWDYWIVFFYSKRNRSGTKMQSWLGFYSLISMKKKKKSSLQITARWKLYKCETEAVIFEYLKRWKILVCLMHIAHTGIF